MDTYKMFNSISEGFQRRVVDCINMALHDDLPRYLAEFQPDTTNGVPQSIGDWINTKIRKYLTGNNVEVIEFNRYSWRGKIIVDKENLITYTIMREKRLHQLRREEREKPHYLQTIVAILNSDFIAPQKQMSFLEMDFFQFDDKMLEQDYDSIFKGQVSKTDGFHHCAIIYETDGGSLSDINILFLDKDLDEVDRISLNEFINPDFSKLTAIQYELQQDDVSDETPSVGLLALRHREETNFEQETDSNPVGLPEKQKSLEE
ncbi:MAG: DUF5986 family protein [Desulfosporosinus sp.]|nr:DUF5986 family protein [Desulfosporosinus sp.]